MIKSGYSQLTALVVMIALASSCNGSVNSSETPSGRTTAKAYPFHADVTTAEASDGASSFSSISQDYASPEEWHFKRTAGASTFELVRVGDRVCVKLPGTDWAVDAAPAASELDFLLTQPTANIDALHDADGAEYLGKESVFGVQTEHFRLIPDQEAYRESLHDQLAAARNSGLPDELITLLETRIGSKLMTEVWVSEDALVRRRRETSVGPNARQVSETQLSKFGDPVHIKLPC
jgi:hypothetical protein